jgi:carbamoyltransferase
MTKIISLHNGHDASITAMEDGKVLYHWELERILNRKHLCGIDYQVSPIDGVLLEHCLPKLGWTTDDIDIIVLGGQTEWKNTQFASIVKAHKPNNYDNLYIKDAIYENSFDRPWGSFKATWHGKERTFYAVTHHVSHMALAYYTSPFDSCLTFAYDGLGDYDSSTVWGYGRKGKLYYRGNFRHQPEFPNNGIGLCYSYLGRVFPFLGTDLLATAGKAMGLSSYGKPYPKDSEIYKACYEIITTWMPSPEHIFARIAPHGITKQDCSDAMNEKCQNLMATFQECLEQYLCNAVQFIQKQQLALGNMPSAQSVRNLAIAGGCALNVQANTRLLTEKIIDKIYVPPAVSDCGISYGALLYIWYNVLENPWTPVEFHDPYIGDTLYNAPPHWSEENSRELEQFADYMDKHYPNLQYKNLMSEDMMVAAAVSALAEGSIIAWAHGRTEIGPRALGNRSILCHPGKFARENVPTGIIPWHNGGMMLCGTMKDTINEKVKHREFWRPFAPIALWPEAQDYFELDHEQPYMLEAPLAKDWGKVYWGATCSLQSPSEVKEARWMKIASVVHVDGTCRVQTVTEKTNRLLNNLLREFYKVTGLPVLLNTSLNDKGIPINNQLEDILNLVRDTKLDFAFIGNWVFSKRK